MELAQGVDHALDWNTSQRPSTQGDVEALSSDVQRGDVVHGKLHLTYLLSRQRGTSRCDTLGIRIERVNPGGGIGCEGRQAALSAADVEHALPLEADVGCDGAWLVPCAVASVHQGLYALTVAPFAPNLMAFSRVSSNAERM